jgi:alanyl-tRNA synthetase
MTDRLYYPDSFLYKFDAEIRAVLDSPRPAVILDCSAFYPTSGGQLHDTGHITLANNDHKFRVTEVADTEDGHIVHYLEAPLKDVEPGSRIHGEIDIARRRDHMQQHSAQHVLSAAFIRLYDMLTVSFHMADDYCSIDLDTPMLTGPQVEAAERLANEIVLENRPVKIRYVTRDEAAALGLRKPPAEGREQLRLIDIQGIDLSACGGTHVESTGQIAGLLCRKFEKSARRGGWNLWPDRERLQLHAATTQRSPKLPHCFLHTSTMCRRRPAKLWKKSDRCASTMKKLWANWLVHKEQRYWRKLLRKTVAS